MPRIILILLGIGAIAICGVFFTPYGAFAQPQCDMRDSIVAQLSQKYQEHQTAIGVTLNGGLVEVFTTEGGETWTIIVTMPGGFSCLVAAGEGWQTLNPAQAGRPM